MYICERQPASNNQEYIMIRDYIVVNYYNIIRIYNALLAIRVPAETTFLCVPTDLHRTI